VLLRFPNKRATRARPMFAGISTVLLAFTLAGVPPLHGQDQSPSVDALGPIANGPAGSFCN
jgi:hypothetical protein